MLSLYRMHNRSHVAELNDNSIWRIRPADIAKILLSLPTTEIDVVNIEDGICSHPLIDRCNSSGLSQQASNGRLIVPYVLATV